MTPRDRVLAALRGGHADRVPFTLYESKIPQCAAERAMRNAGLCIVNRRASVVKTHRPNVTERQEVTFTDGKRLVRSIFQTPVGTLTAVTEDAGYTQWHHEFLFKSPDDYRALLFYLQDTRYEPCYDAFLRQQEELGSDIILRVGLELEPLQLLISSSLMNPEDFCIQWMENRDEILKLYQANVENHRRLYPLVAQSPITHVNYGGNVIPEIVGGETFRKYYVPHYNEAAEVMHRHGKLIGCHFDDDCKFLSPDIAGTDLDYIEAFTPSPDSDMTVADARAAWPNKVLWMNFPSSRHWCPDEEVERIAFDLIEQWGSADGVLMAVTEDMPAERWQNSCQAIMRGLERHAQERPGWYR